MKFASFNNEITPGIGIAVVFVAILGTYLLMPIAETPHKEEGVVVSKSHRDENSFLGARWAVSIQTMHQEVLTADCLPSDWREIKEGDRVAFVVTRGLMTGVISSTKYAGRVAAPQPVAPK